MSVFGRRAAANLLEGSAEGGLIVESAGKSDLRYTHVTAQKLLGMLDPLVGQIIIKGGTGILFEQAYKMIF